VTLQAPGKYEICVLCNWEDEGLGEAELDERSGANQGYTLRDARRNFARRLNMYGEDDPAARETHETLAAKQHIISALQTLGTLPAVKHERLWALIEHTEAVLRADRQRRRLQPQEEVKRLTPIGYWHSENGDGLPHPPCRELSHAPSCACHSRTCGRNYGASGGTQRGCRN
jgi:Cysteine-rich CPCC